MTDKMTVTEAEITQLLEKHFRRFVSATHFRRDANGRACIDVEFRSADNKELKPATN